ncbi:MAG: hypothetical protein V8T85_16375 [Blautia faecicola]
MEKKKKTARLLNDASMGFFLLSSLIIPLLPFADQEKHPAVAIFAGGLFWIGLIWGCFLYYLSYRKVKKTKGYQTLAATEKIGAIAFGSTPEGLIADIAFIPGILISILGTFFVVLPNAVMLIAMWVAIVSCYGHFVLNGRTYKFIHKRKVKRYRTKEQKETAETEEQEEQLEEGV